eukprot:364358-Chlamydomonas_euryale.AAC.14
MRRLAVGTGWTPTRCCTSSARWPRHGTSRRCSAAAASCGRSPPAMSYGCHCCRRTSVSTCRSDRNMFRLRNARKTTTLSCMHTPGRFQPHPPRHLAADATDPVAPCRDASPPRLRVREATRRSLRGAARARCGCEVESGSADQRSGWCPPELSDSDVPIRAARNCVPTLSSPVPRAS